VIRTKVTCLRNSSYLEYLLLLHPFCQECGPDPSGDLEQVETERVLECAKKFVTPKGAVIAFQKNAWNNLRSENDLVYKIERAREGKLKGTLNGSSKIPLFCVPPTRLSGPCSKVLKRFLVKRY